MLSHFYVAGTIIIPILEMEKLRLRAKVLPKAQPRKFDPEATILPTGP